MKRTEMIEVELTHLLVPGPVSNFIENSKRSNKFLF